MYSVGGDTDILKLQFIKRYRSTYWKDVGQLTEKAGTKLEISTVDCDLVHTYIEKDTSTFTSPGAGSSSSTATESGTTTATTPTTTLSPTASPSPCPFGWSEFEGNCYKYYDIFVSWENARSRCLIEKVFITLLIVGTNYIL